MIDRDKLREIKTFPSLVKYLRDELDWPIETDDFEELTFDYRPEELGIDPKTAANIQEIKQLRPLVTNQPWGIFFIKFEPKHLPIVVLRRILSQLVIKKRASARKSEQASWNLNDLLFISNYGEGDRRQITFAHFAQDKITGDLPTLKVLGWDDADTALHIDHVHQELKEKLCWPENKNDLDGWREKWSSAFILRHREVITTSIDLSIHLADLAKRIRSRANQILNIETENGPLRKLHKAFQQALIHDLEKDDFADMYAQTIAYGLLAARASRPTGITSKDLPDMVSITNPFLKGMLGTFLTVGGRKGKMDFDELGIREIVDLLNSPDTHMKDILRDFGDRTRQEDPVIHFYELFLAEYDKKKKVERGVFYTPQPVVSYIVRSVHEILQKEFGLEDGLADTTTWGEIVKRNPTIKKPEVVSPDEAFVNILDPAVGTATFLVEVIDVIHNTMTTKWRKNGLNEKQILAEWNEYVPKHLLSRLCGFELMMAPYAIAHMKLGLKLMETGYHFASDERARIFLTNSLEPASDMDKQLEMWSPELAHEAQAVNKVKRHKHFTVVIGNPPYSYESANRGEWISTLVKEYYQVDGQPLAERNPKGLQDDYVKFIRFAQKCIEEANEGIMGFITNHGFLDNPTFRGMRQNLIRSFEEIYLYDLHGNAKKREKSMDGSDDKNVFGIQQGVAITVGIREKEMTVPARTHHADLLGSRQVKYDSLNASHLRKTTWALIQPTSPFYLFVAQDSHLRSEYEYGWKISELTKMNSVGIATSRDDLTIHYNPQDVITTVRKFVAFSVEKARNEFRLGNDARDWQVALAQEDLKTQPITKSLVKEILYRPFDFRYTYYTGKTRGFISMPRYELIRHMLSPNLALYVGRQGQAIGGAEWNLIFCGKLMEDYNLYRRGNNACFPLFLYPPNERELNLKSVRPNFNPEFLKSLAERLKLQQVEPHWLPKGIIPEDIFQYAYAIFYSPNYRNRYAEFLKIDFPRLPLTSSLDLFHALVGLGSELVALHLMESSKLNKPLTKLVGKDDNEVVKVRYEDKTVWINSSQGFQGVAEDVWNFQIGGYQVCEKWLKDRKGRGLSDEDISHYHRILVAVSETIRLMSEIDKVIEKHGGWPGAFTTAQNVQTEKEEATTPLLPQEEFIISLIKRLGKGKNRGVHSVYSGFNGLFKEKFPGEKPQAWTKKMAEEGRIVITPITGKGKEYQMIYLPEDAPKN